MQPPRVPSPTPDAARDSSIFFVYMALALLLLPASLYAARKHNELAGFLLVPFLCVALFYENLTIAVNALAGGTVPEGMQRLRGAEMSFVIPLFLVTEFELNYEVHKRRSANFFGCITFDQGHRTSTGFFGKLVRYSVWVLALVVLLVQIVVNAPDMTNPSTTMPLTTRFSSKDLGIGRTAGGVIDWSDAIDFFPTAILIAFSAYSGISLWRYGTTISTDVRTTAINPWMSLFVATIGVTLAWVLSPPTWELPYAANAMEIVLLASLVIVLALVDLNLRTLEDWDEVIGAANEAVFAIMAGRAKEAELIGAQQQAAAQAQTKRASSRAGMLVRDNNKRRHRGPASSVGASAPETGGHTNAPNRPSSRASGGGGALSSASAKGSRASSALRQYSASALSVIGRSDRSTAGSKGSSRDGVGGGDSAVVDVTGVELEMVPLSDTKLKLRDDDDMDSAAPSRPAPSGAQIEVVSLPSPSADLARGIGTRLPQQQHQRGAALQPQLDVAAKLEQQQDVDSSVDAIAVDVVESVEMTRTVDVVVSARPTTAATSSANPADTRRGLFSSSTTATAAIIATQRGTGTADIARDVRTGDDDDDADGTDDNNFDGSDAQSAADVDVAEFGSSSSRKEDAPRPPSPEHREQSGGIGERQGVSSMQFLKGYKAPKSRRK